MQPIIAALDDRLANAGDTLPFAGHTDDEGYLLGEHEFTLPSGLDFDLMLTNAGEGILATGIVRAQVEGVCDRCLDPARFDIAGEVDEYFLFHAPSQTASLGEGEDDVDFSLVSADHSIDLTEAIWSAVMMDTPFVVLCREDCKGLCPVCGHNLNEVDCGHAAQIEESRLASSPFAKLRSLKLQEQPPE